MVVYVFVALLTVMGVAVTLVAYSLITLSLPMVYLGLLIKPWTLVPSVDTLELPWR